MARMLLLRARLLLLEAGALVESGGLLLRAGRIERVLGGPPAVARARTREVAFVDLGEGVLAPGLVDAHAHLELGALRGRVPAGEGFVGWIRALIAARGACSESDLREGARRGLERLAATGTTAVGDITTTGAGEHALLASTMRARLFRELLDGDDSRRTRAALAHLARPRRARAGLARGISPHSPFTVSDAALRSAARSCRRARWPIMVHWSETKEELAWMQDGSGPLAALLERPPLRSGLDRLDDAGLLGPRTALVHGNHPLPGEIERIAAAGASLVHCPGSHRFFDRERFPVEAYLERGVVLALGTDSPASNDDLDMRREMALLREASPGIAPETVWQSATEGGARALGWSGELGRLRPGWRADLAFFRVHGRSARSVQEELTAGMPDVLATWVGGRALFTSERDGEAALGREAGSRGAAEPRES